MRINHNNLTIRNAEPGDAELLCRWWNDGSVMAHAGFPLGVHTTPEKIRKQLAENADDVYRNLILEIDGLPVGEMSYRNKGSGVAEIGIKICEADFQGRGYGTLFLKLLIACLFADFGYAKIILDTNEKNTRAQHVYEKLGFRRLRVVRDAWKDQLGEPQTAVEYELLPGDFAHFILIPDTNCQ